MKRSDESYKLVGRLIKFKSGETGRSSFGVVKDIEDLLMKIFWLDSKTTTSLRLGSFDESNVYTCQFTSVSGMPTRSWTLY